MELNTSGAAKEQVKLVAFSKREFTYNSHRRFKNK